MDGLDLVNTDRRTFDLGSTPVKLTVRDASWASWCRCLPCGLSARRSPDLVSIEWSRIVLPGRSVAHDAGHARHQVPDGAAPPSGGVEGGRGVGGQGVGATEGDAADRPTTPVTATVRVNLQPLRNIMLYIGKTTKAKLNTTGGLISSLARSVDGLVECVLGIFKDVYHNAHCVVPAALKAQLHVDGFSFPIWSRPSTARQSCSLNESLRQFSPDPTDYLRAMTRCVKDIDEKTLGEGEKENVARFKELIAELVVDSHSQVSGRRS